MRRTGLLHRLIYGRPAKLRTYEKLLLDAVREQLPRPASLKLREQISRLPFRQRHSDDRVLAFFPDKGVEMPPEVLFENMQDNLEFATAELCNPSRKEDLLRAKLTAASGFFFSVEFDKTPATVGVVDGGEVALKSVQILVQLDKASGDV